MKMAKSEQNFVKKKLTKGQASLPKKKNVSVDNGSQAEVKIEKKSKKVDVIVIDIDGESLDESEQKAKTKKKIVTESVNASCVKNGNDKEVNKKKKKLEIAPLSSVKEKVEEKPRKVNKIQKSVQIKLQNVKLEKEQKEELPKRAKKRKTILVVNTEKSEEQVKEKKKQKTTDEEICEGITITKKRKSAKVTDNGVKLGKPGRDTCEVKVKKEADAKEEQNKLATPRMKGNNKRSKAASGQKVEKDDMPKKKRDKSTKSEIVIIDEETELKTNRKKEKGRKASVEVNKVEEKEPKKKKKGKSMAEEEEPLILKCEEVEEQISETGAADATGKKRKKKKKSSVKVETVSFGTGAKKRKIKEEVEDQHDSHIVDVVFMSEKTGNVDEVTINQERRQALQMEIDKASQPQKPDKPTGLGQWGSAQFDSSDQQQKFLRLMGGFKKGSQSAAASSDGANMALGKDAQQQLQQGLLGDFERAQSRRMDFSNRGSGLGFNAPTNKKLSIDVNACRSVRFDD